ncbi:syntaxin-121-like [Impatiens glandulifera]|uniref:syntaxin-121-like n=1 Tax=Impatiens glandulifera TaxID=253017 RepID=UPI001FB15F63|nr:syntaxin-121-like [Impatiens glandulifera]
MKYFNALRQQIVNEYCQIDERRYKTLIGENADEAATAMAEKLIDVCESEEFLQKGILDTMAEIEERNEGSKEMERDLNELHRVFDEMAVMVKNQGEEIDEIENQVKRFSSFVRGGIDQILARKYYQKNSRKWNCFVIIFLLLLLIILFAVLFMV